MDGLRWLRVESRAAVAAVGKSFKFVFRYWRARAERWIIRVGLLERETLALGSFYKRVF